VKAIILHLYPQFGVGGTSAVAAEIGRALKQRGITVHFATYAEPDYELFRSVTGLAPDKLLRERGRGLAAASYPWVGGIFGSVHTLSYDLVVNAIYDHLSGYADLGYIHCLGRRTHKAGQPRSPLKRGLLTLDALFYCKAKTMAANSGWTATQVEEACGVRPEVLYPPVKMCDRKLDVEREDLVVGLGRISEDKNWEDFVEIARKLREKRNTRFVIMGALYEESYLEKLRRQARGCVEFMTDVSEDQKWSILAKSRVVLHTKHAEHFGISVVEAMSCGAVPVVYSDGGVWSDILEKGRYGYGYQNTDEAVEAINQALDNHREMEKEVQMKAQQYADEKFRERILKLLDI